MAFAAQCNALPLQAFVLYIAVFFWVVLYDTQYGLVDREDDLKIGLHSTACYCQGWEIIFLSLSGLCSGMAWVALGYLQHWPNTYYVGLGLIAMACFWQLYTMRDLSPEKCFRAFQQHHYIGMALFLNIWFVSQ